MIRGPPGPGAIMSLPNDEFAQTPARPIVWRRPRRAGVWADGTNRYEEGEPPLRPRGVPGRRGPRAPFRRAGRAGPPRGAGLRRLRRGGRALQARARVPQARPVALEGRPRAPGPRRWRRRPCGARFASLAGAVFEGSGAGLPAWARLIRPMRHNVPPDCAAEPCGVSRQTAFEWRHRVLATVSGHQGRIVLRERAWTDEAYVSGTDPSKGYGQARKRGPSRQKPCILVAIDVRKNPTAAVCGHGKPSSARVGSALAGRLSPGCVVVRDRGRAHSGAIADGGCTRSPTGPTAATRPTSRRWRRSTACAPGSSAASGGSPACRRPTCGCAWTGTSTCSGSTRRGTGGTRPQGSSAT